MAGEGAGHIEPAHLLSFGTGQPEERVEQARFAQGDLAVVRAVRQRGAGRSIPDAPCQHLIDTWLPIAAHPQRQEFDHLVNSTPALRAYAEHMWARHTDTLSRAIADELGVQHDNLACVALARFVLEAPVLSQGQKDRRAAVEEVFGILTGGWRPPSGP